MKKTKKTGAFIISILMAVSFWACGQTGNEQQESNTEQMTTSAEVETQEKIEKQTETEFFKGLNYDVIVDQYGNGFVERYDDKDFNINHIYTHEDGTESRVLMFAVEKDAGATLDAVYSAMTSTDRLTLQSKSTRDYNFVKNVIVVKGTFDGDNIKNREETIAFFESDSTIYCITMEDNVDDNEFERLLNSARY